MLNLKAIRKDPAGFKTRLARKGVAASVIDQLLSADEAHRTVLQKAEEAKSAQNQASKKIPQLSGEEKQAVLDEMKQISETRKQYETEAEEKHTTVKQILESLPNPPREEVPDGPDDSANVVLRTEGKIPEFDFTPKPHWELAEQHNLLDMEQAAQVSGNRFYYLKNELAILQQALMMWAFKKTNQAGFSATIPPFMTRERAIYGTGYLDKDENYIINPGVDDLYLIGTSEVPMVSLHADQVLDLDKPIKYSAYSPCFRREAGSYGKDTKGILRVHQFEKIEMVVFCKPEQATEVHESILALEEEILQDLKIPYQVYDICTGDLGNSASKKYDLEGWMAGSNEFRELTSTSICDDFQTRRLNVRYRDEDGKLQYACALNGTAVSSRPLISILENNQNADGSINIPEVLQPYCGFSRIG